MKLFASPTFSPSDAKLLPQVITSVPPAVEVIVNAISVSFACVVVDVVFDVYGLVPSTDPAGA